LPLYNNPVVQGNLFINFEIEFPKTLDTEKIQAVEKILTSLKPAKLPE